MAYLRYHVAFDDGTDADVQTRQDVIDVVNECFEQYEGTVVWSEDGNSATHTDEDGSDAVATVYDRNHVKSWCRDCGAINENTGHQGCRFPQDH